MIICHVKLNSQIQYDIVIESSEDHKYKEKSIKKTSKKYLVAPTYEEFIISQIYFPIITSFQGPRQ